MSDQTHYTNTCEDEQIVKYIVENNAYNRISGNSLWQEIIAASICNDEDDWISLKEYFHNIILLKIQGSNFPFLTEEHINTFVKNTADYKKVRGSKEINVRLKKQEEEIKSGDYSETIESPDKYNNRKKSDGEKSDIVNNSIKLNLQESVTNVIILKLSDHENEIKVQQCGNKKPREEKIVSGDFDESNENNIESILNESPDDDELDNNVIFVSIANNSSENNNNNKSYTENDVSVNENNIESILYESSDDDELDAAFAAVTSESLENNVIFVSAINSSSENNNNKSNTENDLSGVAEIQSNSTGDSSNNDNNKNVFNSPASLRSDDTMFDVDSCNTSYAVEINKPNDLELNVNEYNSRTNTSLTSNVNDADTEHDTCSEEDCLIKKNKRKSKNTSDVVRSDSDDLISTEHNDRKRKCVLKNP